MPIVCLMYALSGLLSLGYQVVWFRSFVDYFGSTNLTFALVVCCFIGGLGAGALCSRRVADLNERRLGLSDPLKKYGLVEDAISLTVFLTVLAPMIPAGVFGSFPYGSRP